MITTILQHFGRWLQREPHTFLQIRPYFFREVEAAAHHANYSASGAANFHRLSHDVGIGVKTLSPQAFRQQHGRRTSRLTFRLAKGTAKQRVRAEH